MSSTEESTGRREPHTHHAPESPTIQILLTMQQQQLQMQQQMADLMARFLPSTTTQAAATTSELPQHRLPRTKVNRPIIDIDTNDNRWILFCDAWDRYKEMANLTSPDEIRNELRSSCTDKVNEMLFNFAGPAALNAANESDLMRYIKAVAVRAVHPEVHRQQFFSLRQHDGENITSFVSRLKAQAMLCAFTSKGICGSECKISYSEDMVKSQLIAGALNSSHQSRILAEMESLKTLDQVITRLLALESTDRASTHFRSPVDNPSRIAPIIHSERIPDRKYPSKCPGCGQNRHPKGRKSCPAWQKTCNACKRLNHFSSQCRSTSKANAAIEEPFEFSTVSVQPL